LQLQTSNVDGNISGTSQQYCRCLFTYRCKPEDKNLYKDHMQKNLGYANITNYKSNTYRSEGYKKKKIKHDILPSTQIGDGSM